MLLVDRKLDREGIEDMSCQKYIKYELRACTPNEEMTGHKHSIRRIDNIDNNSNSPEHRGNQHTQGKERITILASSPKT